MDNSKAEQYYPTYSAPHRDILLIEFEEAQKIANTQTKAYGQVLNIIVAVFVAVIPFFISQDQSKSNQFIRSIQSNSLLFSLIIFLVGGLLLRYFVDLQKQITINARKVVTLRTLLGLDYGPIHLTLPNWRVEGANNPFAIKYFYGWLTFRCMPFWVVAFGVNIIFWLSTRERSPILIELFNQRLIIHWFCIHIVISVYYMHLFRNNLNDHHETILLHFTKFVATVLNIKLINNFEYILYRAKLAVIELERMKIKFGTLKTILVEIEDRSFYRNPGFSFKSLIRAIFSRFKPARKKYHFVQSGASTITMQLVRTLFIPANQDKIKRKIIEIFLSVWINRQFTKDDVLMLYISSVRYERGVMGLSAALRYFFNETKSKTLTNEESFMLAERLSNITSTINKKRIDHLLTRISSKINREKLDLLYKNQISLGNLKE